MELKVLNKETDYHSGYGAGSGEIIRVTYACPCGKSEVVFEKDDIPGFRDSSTICECQECSSKYDFNRGTATIK
ncbi:hypothetical protein [Carnobacterium divergens]|uniref:hypothetical protein n=1 Tax=Carnobacterium divergens TaxID=2748 RepID=UPI001072DD79|nr:hypothetical protein [Carnobacterium divergens]MPQ22181.1 hypothetical protein [Carnobacterium divergens]TFI75536.1 hypothetical protein CKN81_01485 [Carnobacterium divergens]